VRAYPVQVTPASSNFNGKTVQGVHFTVINRDIFSSSRLGLELANALGTLYPRKIGMNSIRTLVGNSGVMLALTKGADTAPAATAGLQEFLELRQKYLLYH
jgi:uncharacterized protein YbbC (DUF1343 family)